MGISDEPLIRSFDRACEKYPDHTAVIYIGEKFSSKRLKEPLQVSLGIPLPSPEVIVAMVVLKQDARGMGGTELMKWCRDRLASYKIPGYIEFRDMLPKSKVGKLLRREIRDEERRRLAKGERTIRV